MSKTIILTITNACNLQCIYCYESYKNSKTMTFETAKTILEKEIRENVGKELQVDFHGGEPLLNFDLIQRLCDWVSSEDRKCKVHFLVTTNGTLLTDDMKSWLTDNRKLITMALSIDGTKEMHDINRNDSFDKIDINFFLTNWPDQAVKMTVSEHTISDIFQGVIYLQNLGFHISYNLAVGINWSAPRFVEIYKREVDKLVAYYIDNPELNRPENLLKKISSVVSKIEYVRSCGSGVNMTSYDTDGKPFPCQMFSENSLTKEEWDMIANVNFAEESQFKDEECNDCPIYKICSTCYGMNYKERGNIGKRDKRMCEFNKIEALAISKLVYNSLIDKPIEEFDVEEFMELKAAKYIQDKLQII